MNGSVAMPFHVEVSSGLHHARAFNLSREELRRDGARAVARRPAVELGDHEWDPRESELTDPRGPRARATPTSPSARAGRTPSAPSEDVTREMLERRRDERGAAGGPARSLIETDSAVETVAELASAPAAPQRRPGEARERIDGRDPEVAAVILVIGSRQAVGPRSRAPKSIATPRGITSTG